jgi:hypothetical protein
MQDPKYTSSEWRQRWLALEKTMTHTLELMSGENQAARQPTLSAMLVALKAFGHSQMKFFLQGFDLNGKTVRLEPSTKYPPEYALRTTLDNLAQDMDIITRSWQQRMALSASAEMIEALAQADKLAYQALLPAIHRKIVPPATIVTYFQKSTTVRLIPYAPVILIGLPISIMTAPQDLLAVPHEVGHYVYRYGQVPAGCQFAGSRFPAALRYRFADKPSWCLDWMEEIFADVYGALIGGPAMALGFEALVIDNPIDEFIEDDGEHPVAALRPNIYHTVFGTLGRFPQANAELITRWEERRKEWGNPQEFTPNASNKDEKVSLDDAQHHLDEIIVSLLKKDLAGIRLAETTQEVLPKGSQGTVAAMDVIHPWSSELPQGEPLAALLGQFNKYVKALERKKQANPPELQVVEDTISMQVAGMAAVERKIGETGLWLDAIKAVADKQHFYMPPEAWMPLLDGSGWATEGPEGGIAHGK